ncbi:glycoside hydrolase family 17 protein [Agrocybe pediades]|nr:glycoside hydrolase family 17 protein [Agrocybe pediades]
MDPSYQSLGMSGALEKQKQRSRRSKFIVIGSVIGLIVLIAVGVTLGVVFSRKDKSSGNSNSSGVKAGSGGTTSGSKSGDPSVFEKDPRLHRSFYGLAYTPEGSLPDYGCSSTLEHVIQDVQLMSQLTGRVRLYGADCNQTALVLEAIRLTKVDLKVYLGNYVVEGDPGAYERQRDVLKSALQTYDADNIEGVTVGNEFMLNYAVGHSIEDVNSAAGDEGAEILIKNIADTRDMLASLNLGKNILVGNSDAGSYFNNKVLEAVDYGLSNVHAWFANTTIEEASGWVRDFFEETNVKPASLLPNKPKMYIAETGWPTDSKDEGNKSNGFAEASVANLQTFIDHFVCEANAAGIPYFFFEYFDEEWKGAKYGGVEGHWGVFNKDRTLKDITIPDCPSP